MKIGIDIRALQSHNEFRGIGRYISSLLSSITFIDSKNEYVFYVFSDRPNPLKKIKIPDTFSYKIENIEPIYKSHKVRLGIFYKENYPIDSNLVKGLDVFFQPDLNYGLPRGVKTVTVFYDLIPLLFWNKNKSKMYKGLRRVKISLADKILQQKYLSVLKSYRKADRIIAISNSSKNDLLKFSREINSSRVKTVHLGVDTIPKRTGALDIKLPKNYLLYVGGIDLRKNITGLAKIFFEIKSQGYDDLKLVMMGKEFKNERELYDLGWYESVEGSNFLKDIIFTGYVKDEELVEYYKHAKAFVFPSLYEGFGLPVLEAMAMGAPVVAFKNSSITEIAENAALLCKDNKEFIEGVKSLLENNKLRKSLIEKGYKQAKKFSWEKTAKETLKVIEGLVKQED